MAEIFQPACRRNPKKSGNSAKHQQSAKDQRWAFA
jgi:hypothetical protein